MRRKRPHLDQHQAGTVGNKLSIPDILAANVHPTVHRDAVETAAGELLGGGSMDLIEYLLGVVFFCGVFRLGRWMADQDRKPNRILLPSPALSGYMCKFVHYSGRVFQVVAVVWGFLDAVSVMVLTGGWITDFLVNVQSYE